MRRLRVARGISAAAVGRELNVGKVFVGKLERGEKKPSVDRLIDIARVLDCTLESLLIDYARGTL